MSAPTDANRPLRTSSRTALAGLPLLTSAACSGGEGQRHWGESAKTSAGFGRVGDALRIASWGAYAAAGTFAPAPEEDWLESKAKGFSVGTGAIRDTTAVTGGLKSEVGRRRPDGGDGGDDRSFPSGHTSSSAVSVRLTRDTLRHYDLSPAGRIAADVGTAGLAVVTGWARVEAGVNYPADVLAGMAIGNFLAVFTTEAFLQPVAGDAARLSVTPARGGMMLRLGFKL